MIEICLAIIGLLFPVVFWTAYKVGKIETGLEGLGKKVDNYINGGKKG